MPKDLPSRPYRFPVLLLTAALISSGLSGCMSLPTGGEPHAFDLHIPDSDPIDQIGVGPQQDSAPERLVSDFFRACAASDEFVTAGRYLTDEAAGAWQPFGSVLIYSASDPPALQIVSADTKKDTVRVQVTVKVVASVDADGVFALGPDHEIKLDFELLKDKNGQWRINRLDDGILLSRSAFSTTFQQGQLYFYAARTDSLVPDPRWLPRKRMASRLVGALLAGPSEQIRAAVSSTASESLSLPTKGVEISGGNATVALVGSTELTERARERLLDQLAATLGQVEGVEKVTLELNSVEIGSRRTEPEPSFGFVSLIGIKDGAFVVDGSEGVEVLVAGQKVGMGVKKVAASTAEDPLLAWMDGEGKLSLAPQKGQAEIQTDTYGKLVPFGVDRWNWVWIADSRGSFTVRSAQNDTHPVAVGSDVKITNVAVSPSGLRILFSVEGEAGVTLYTGVIERNDQGRPQRLLNVTPLTFTNDQIMDFAWSGDLKMMVLVKKDQEHRELWAVPISGFTQSSPVRVPATSVIASPLGNPTYLGDDEGQMYMKVGAIWRLTQLDFSLPTFP